MWRMTVCTNVTAVDMSKPIVFEIQDSVTTGGLRTVKFLKRFRNLLNVERLLK